MNGNSLFGNGCPIWTYIREVCTKNIIKVKLFCHTELQVCWFFTLSHRIIWLWRWSIINHWIPYSWKLGSFDISASLSIYLLATWMSTNMCLAAQDIVLKSLISCYLPNNNIVYVQIIQPLNWVRVFTLVFAVCVALWYYFIRDYWLGTKKDSQYHIGYYRDSQDKRKIGKISSNQCFIFL